MNCFGLAWVGKSVVRVKDPAEGCFGLANGFRDGEGPVEWIMAGSNVVMIPSSPTLGYRVASRLCFTMFLFVNRSPEVYDSCLSGCSLDQADPSAFDLEKLNELSNRTLPVVAVWSCDISYRR